MTELEKEIREVQDLVQVICPHSWTYTKSEKDRMQITHLIDKMIKLEMKFEAIKDKPDDKRVLEILNTNRSWLVWVSTLTLDGGKTGKEKLKRMNKAREQDMNEINKYWSEIRKKNGRLNHDRD